MQQEVEDIRQELLKLLRTINSTTAGILGAENELQQKVRFICLITSEPDFLFYPGA